MTDDLAERQARDTAALEAKMHNTLAMIREDIPRDVQRFEGAPFTGRVVAEMYGNLAACVAAIAGIVDQVVSLLAEERAKTRAGEQP